MTKTLPKDITTYDLLKTFAVIIMVVDHVGWYFFPDDDWWRAVGRIGFPVWFFLVGYARGRDLPFKLMAGAFLLMAGNFIAGMPVFPLNALFTIALIRVSIDFVMTFSLKSKWHLWGGSVVLLLLIAPTYVVTEYGTQALITAIFGYFIRHRQAIDDENTVFHYMIFALVSFVLVQQVVFGFTVAQFAFMAIGTALVRLMLYRFKPLSFPKATAKVPAVMTWVTQLCGRRTLEIYVIHLLAFKALAVYWGLEGYELFAWSWLD